MVEYGPFIEYCCELYIHHDVVNIVCAFAAVVLVLNVIASSLLLIATFKRHT